MKLFLYGSSAAQWWSFANSAIPRPSCFGSEGFVDCAPSVNGVRYLRRVAPFLSEPFHFVVPGKNAKRNVCGAKVHSSSYPFPEGSFAHVANGIYVPSPELCFIQLVQSVPTLQVLQEGYNLCGSFLFDPASETGLSDRAPLTSASAIRRYASDNLGLRGARLATRLSSLLKDGSASPRETGLAMILTLPHRLGGYGLDGAVLNRRIDLRSRARRFADGEYYVADMLWPEAKVVVEYDSDLHLSSRQLAHDAEKRRALEADGYLVLTVTKLQFGNPDEMRRVALAIARRVGKRLRPQSADFERRLILLCRQCLQGCFS